MKTVAQLITYFYENGTLTYEQMIYLRDNDFPLPSSFIPWDDPGVTEAATGKSKLWVPE